MGSLIGAGGRANKKTLPATSLRVQTSIQGRPRAIGAGQNRVSGNLIWYGAFTAYRDGSSSGKGGGGAKGGASGYHYSATLILSLGEGPIGDLLTIYSGNNIQFIQPPDPAVLADLQALGITVNNTLVGSFLFADGNYGQTAWGYMTSLYPSQALNYRGQAYIGHPNLALGSTTTAPNYTHEIRWAIANAAPGVPDANPADWVAAVLTNPDWGALGFPAALLGNLGDFRTFAQAYGLFVSPVLTDPTAVQSHLSDLLRACASDFRWSQGRLEIVPYADVTATGHGATWAPNVTPVLDLTTDHFLPVEDESSSAPITTKRPASYDSLNQVAVEYLDRSNIYNPCVLYASDDAAVAAAGREQRSDTRAQHFFCTASAARSACALQLGRERTLRTHVFRLPEQFILLDPFDIVTLTDRRLGYERLPVRITEIQGNADRSLTFTAEDVPGTLRSTSYPVQKALGSASNGLSDPGGTNPPVIFEPPPALASGQVWIAASGVEPSTWGGCNVFVSLDGETFAQAGVLTSASAQGVTTAALPASTSGGTDAGATLSVDMSLSGVALASVSADAFAALASLSYLDGELLAFETATLTGAGQYDLTTLARGAYGTAATAHASGAPFVRLDGNVFAYAYPPSLVGRSIWIKLQPFNLYGGGSPTLDTLTAYPYTVVGQAGTAPAYVSDADHTLSPTETAVYFTVLTASRVVSLPLAGDYGMGRTLIVADQSGHASTSILITVHAASGETVNGVATTTIGSAYGAITLTAGASGWTIVSRTGA